MKRKGSLSLVLFLFVALGLWFNVPETSGMGKRPVDVQAEQTAVVPLPLEAARTLLKEEVFPPEKELIFLTRNEVIRIALERNLDILIARYDSRIESLELEKSRAVFDTTLTLDGEYEVDEFGKASTVAGTREVTGSFDAGLKKTLPAGTTLELDFENERNSTDSTFRTLNPSYESKLSVTLTQPILQNRFGMLDRGEVEKTKLEISMVDEEVFERVLNAVAQVEKDYWALVLAKEEEAITEEVLAKAEALLLVNLDKYERGVVEEVDLHASYANVAMRKSNVAVAKNKTESAIRTLKLGLNDFSGTVLLPADRFIPDRFRADLEESLVRAFQNRHDYKKARLEIEKNKLEIRLEGNKRWPKLDLKGTLAANGLEAGYGDALEELVRWNQRDAAVGVTFEFPLENREANANFRQAEFKKLQSLLSLQKTERDLFREVDEQFRAVNTLAEKVRYAVTAESHQRQKLEEEEKNFAIGRSDVNTLVDFQQDLLEARMNTVRALYDYYEAAVDLTVAEASLLAP